MGRNYRKRSVNFTISNHMKTIKLIIDGKEIEAKIKDKDAETISPTRAKRWEDLGEIDGWLIDDDGNVNEFAGCKTTERLWRPLFAKNTQAEGVLAMAQLSQLMKHINGGWEPDWSSHEPKNTIYCHKSGAWAISVTKTPSFLCFKDWKIAKQFLEDHKNLLNEYAKIYL